MNEMKEAVGNWREAKQFSPADENDFLRWLDKADTEEKLFSRLTFWFTFRGLPADQNQRYHLVQERARELRLWNGLELKLRRWQDRVADEYEQIGKEAFAARIGEDYADYINSLTDPEAAPQQAAPEPETAKPAGVQAWSARELSEMELPPIRHVVEGLLPMGMGVLEMLGEYLDANPDIHLVCIDTLSKIKPKAKPFENAYDADYDYMGRLKAFADSRGICVLLVHHTRKSKNPEDSFDNINGSTGILGAADFTIVLDKQSRMDDEAGFLLTGRDIEQCERVIRFDKARCRWVMQGTAAQLAAQRRVAEYEAEPIVKTLRVLLQQGDGTWSGNAQALMQMGERYTNEELASSTRALAGRIKELQPMLWERDAIKCWDKQNGTGGKRYCFKMNRIDNTAPVMDSAQLSLRHNYR